MSATKAQLIISEIYFAGTDEWLEITNYSDQAFSGAIVLSGAKSSSINLGNINIAAQEQQIFGDKLEMVIDHSLVGLTGLGLSMYDTRELFVELLSSGQVVDSISATAEELAEIKSHKASLQKIISGTLLITTGAQNYSGYNIAEGYIANPGTMYETNDSIGTGTATGFACSGINMQIQITEIFPGDEKYPPFIELQALSDFDGEIVISGSAIAAPLTINLTLMKNNYMLISTRDDAWLSTIDTHREAGLELNNSGGSIFVYRQGGQILDSIFLEFGSGVQSVYTNSGQGDEQIFEEISGVCVREFSRLNFFSPGFDEIFLHYISSGYVYVEIEKIVEEIVEIETVVYITTGCDLTGAITTGTITSGAVGDTGVQSLTNGQFIEILSIEYDPEGSDTNNERVVLKSHIDYPVTIDYMRLHSLSRTTKNRIYGDLPAQGELEMIGNYRFPNSANCVELLSGDVVLDTYCYDPDDKQNNNGDTEIQGDDSGEDETSQFSTENGDKENYKISIENLIYDVEGSDKDRETIVIKLLSGETLDLDDLSDFKLLIGTRKTKLFYPDLNNANILQVGENKTFTGNFRFPNTKNTCVSLMLNEHVFDTHCYEIPGEEKKEPKNISQEETLLNYFSGNIKIISLLPNPIGSDVGAEEIIFLFTNTKFQTQTQSGNQELVFDDKFRLKINTQNKKISGTLKNNIAKTFTGSFSFPNTAACVSITYDGKILDTFCYEKPEEGVLFTQKNGSIEQLSTIDLSILQKAQFKKFNNKICLVYDEQTIHCKNYNFGKIYSASYDELRLYKSYIKTIDGYLSNNWPTLFFNSPLQYYQKLFKQAKSQIKSGEKTRNIYGKTIDMYDIESQARELIFATPTEIFQRKIIEQIIPDSIRQQYYFLLRK